MGGRGVVDEGMRAYYEQRAAEYDARHRVYERFLAPDGLADELGGARVLHAGHSFVIVAAP
jgi:hypothetical protein